MTLIEIIKNASDQTLADEIFSSYEEIETNFIAKKWKVTELDAGHFVEAVRRFIELKLFGSYTPIGTNLPNFNEAELRRYENTHGDESYRILIPRSLYVAYAIRNKRGVGHISPIKSNQMDATLIFQIVKWVLAELVRLNSPLDTHAADKLVEKITTRQIDILWKHNGVTRILNTKIKTFEKIIVLLYDSSPQTIEQLRINIKYKNKSEFTKILKKLDSQLLIESKPDTTCFITPLGESKAEKIIISLGS